MIRSLPPAAWRVPARVLLFAVLAVLAASAVEAQSPSAPAPQGSQAVTQPQVTLPPVTVTAQKEPSDPQRLPVSVTAVLPGTLADAAITSVSDAAIYAPNTFFVDFTARKLSNPRFRGIGSSPANPGITTYIDGVPQLNANSSSIELVDIEQIEYARGPQSALFGRNMVGGLVNINSARPSLNGWTGQASVPAGNFSSFEIRGSVSGPMGKRLAVGFAGGRSQRDGFTINTVTGHDLDYRAATFGKAQLLWVPTNRWETRLIVNGERARDGDYALGDLASLRANPFKVARDFEGHTDRDIAAGTFVAQHHGDRVTFASHTGLLRWTTADATDLDYTPMSIVTRTNDEKDLQFTEEIRLASAPGAPVRLSDSAILKWQAGASFFTQRYDQSAVNTFSPYVLSPFLGFPVAQHSPDASLDDAGFGLYGQGTVTLKERLDLALGARLDHEVKNAVLKTFYAPPIAPPTAVDTDDSFTNVSPQFSLGYRLQRDVMAYVSLGRGFKAGGFNPASAAGLEAYDEEYSTNVEGGLKTLWGGGRASTNVSVFSTDWSDLQLNLPNPQVPGQFYIANVGSARTSGVEVEAAARPYAGVDLFAAFGYTHARFGSGTSSSGADVSGNTLPNTPDYTGSFGAQLSRTLGQGLTAYGRAETVCYGAFKYDDANTAGQEAYSVTNFRFGVRGRVVFAEGWVKNAFDSRYIPVAFAYGAFAPSGFVGESGRPRTFGVSAGVKF